MLAAKLSLPQDRDGFQPTVDVTGDCRPCSVREPEGHCVHCPVLASDEPDPGPAYIMCRYQDSCNIVTQRTGRSLL